MLRLHLERCQTCLVRGWSALLKRRGCPVASWAVQTGDDRSWHYAHTLRGRQTTSLGLWRPPASCICRMPIGGTARLQRFQVEKWIALNVNARAFSRRRGLVNIFRSRYQSGAAEKPSRHTRLRRTSAKARHEWRAFAMLQHAWEYSIQGRKGRSRTVKPDASARSCSRTYPIRPARIIGSFDSSETPIRRESVPFWPTSGPQAAARRQKCYSLG